MNDEELTKEDVVRICSNAHLFDGSMTFESFGTGEVRVDTQEFLYEHGLMLEDAEEVVNNLTVDDYYKGPKNHYDDNRRKHQLWEFKKNAFDMVIYIKVVPFNKNRYIAVISFHEDR